MIAYDVITDDGRTSLQHFPDDGEVWLFVHGILGSKANWRSFAKAVIHRRAQGTPEQIKKRRVAAVAVDLRAHGDSHDEKPPHTVEACAQDLAHVMLHIRAASATFDMRQHHLCTYMVGHSFGGKVVLLAMRYIAAQGVFVVDTPPGERSEAKTTAEILHVLDSVRHVPMPIPSRRDLVEHLQNAGLSVALAQWMTTNLREAQPDEGSGFVWRFDLDACTELLHDFAKLDCWNLVESSRGFPHIHLIRGEKSDRFTDADIKRMQTLAQAYTDGLVTYSVVPKAGHWVHSDNPQGLLQILVAG